MSNLLAIPFKKSYALDLKEPARRYLQDHTSAHPDSFKVDIDRWQELRRDGVGGTVHKDGTEKMNNYHAQLLSILAKLPSDIGLDISYAPVFSPNAIPVTLRSLAFERAAVLFNLAALYSQLAGDEDRSHMEGIKLAISCYQNAAGTLSYLRSSALKELSVSPQDEEMIPLDLDKSCIHSLEWLMRAQAQECFWQKAKIDGFKNALIAKLAANTSALYKLSISAIRDASPLVKSVFPTDWLAHIEAKQHHFEAVAQFRKSVEELENSSYGVEISRLQEAQNEAKRASDIARRRRVSQAVVQDIQSLVDAVKTALARAERDNDLIYHQDIPAASALSPIPHAEIALVTIPKGLSNPAKGTHMIFGELLGWGAQEAINIYNDRKKNLVEDQIVVPARELKNKADEMLTSHNLPASIEALERPVGLPPSLLKKAEEVRLENGPMKIESWFEDLQRQARHDFNILEEAMDILDTEASEDEVARKELPLNRPPSHEANIELIEKEKRYRAILDQAKASDDTVRRKWDDWESNITDLTFKESELEAMVPSSTASSRKTPEAAITSRYARHLRVLLESLDTLHADREQYVRRAEALSEADDIYPRILKVASGIERLTKVEPATFEDVLDEELAKYDKFCEYIKESEQKQEDILSSIEADNEKFLKSRKDDPSVKEREHALQSLDLSYHKYREITNNLQEGIKFYNDLSGLLLQFKDSCKIWCNHRQQEIHALSQSLGSMSLQENDDAQDFSEEDIKDQPEVKVFKKFSSGLPPLNSSEWGFEEIKLPPGPSKKSSRMKV
ncbi:BRO1-domain-containing protein [Guyanagaster necrorhizus]|uniref:BRO1-domain-containing protein n=1 Tax=Guyanagaster necrorhizus TaxID=856835 RepID=A0A9P7W5G0_9AGAR|nr:BRO1-domain-containing protein [Guyanagaster necrorhizus MCA 3950]KAG7452534.1 BRO1-domain-containing protein [Guyanagaster necrorhizus MCA 3950]